MRSRKVKPDIRMATVAPKGASEWFLKSAKTFGHSGIRWSMGDIIIDLHELRSNGFTHALYTDSDDVIFTGTRQRILGGYERRGFPPVLFSSWNENPNVGQYIGRIDALLTMWAAINARYNGTPQERMNQAWEDKVNILLDGPDAIFRSDARTYNPKRWDTCLLHFNTGAERMEEIFWEVCKV